MFDLWFTLCIFIILPQGGAGGNNWVMRLERVRPLESRKVVKKMIHVVL